MIANHCLLLVIDVETSSSPFPVAYVISFVYEINLPNPILSSFLFKIVTLSKTSVLL